MKHLMVLLLFAPAADAYVGPGAGLSLMAALWGLAVALVTALALVIAWPFRRWRRMRREREQARAADPEDC